MTAPDPPPQDFAALKTRIAARAQKFPKRLSQVAAFALEHTDEIAFGTVSSIAAQAEVQPSTLIRFAQSLGYQGFSEMQEVFRQRLRGGLPSYDERMEKLRLHASKPSAVFLGFSAAAEKSIANLREVLDPAALDRAVDALARAETIYLIGFKRSAPVTAYMAYAFGKLSVRSIMVGATEMDQLNFATGHDAVIAVSFTPYAPETLGLTQSAASRGVPVIAITDSAFSPLAKHATHWFEVVEANFEGFRSLAATLALAMTLTVAIAEKRQPAKPGIGAG